MGVVYGGVNGESIYVDIRTYVYESIIMIVAENEH